MKMTDCACTAAGWCTRHECYKPDPLFQMCQRSSAMFEAWEKGQGPMLPHPDHLGTAENLEGPSLFQRGLNFGRAAIEHASTGFKKVDEATIRTRLAICAECPLCDASTLTCRHTSCGCHLETKAEWESSKCPLGNWPTP